MEGMVVELIETCLLAVITRGVQGTIVRKKQNKDMCHLCRKMYREKGLILTRRSLHTYHYTWEIKKNKKLVLQVNQILESRLIRNLNLLLDQFKVQKFHLIDSIKDLGFPMAEVDQRIVFLK
jgi:hypothetical protein